MTRSVALFTSYLLPSPPVRSPHRNRGGRTPPVRQAALLEKAPAAEPCLDAVRVMSLANRGSGYCTSSALTQEQSTAVPRSACQTNSAPSALPLKSCSHAVGIRFGGFGEEGIPKLPVKRFLGFQNLHCMSSMKAPCWPSKYLEAHEHLRCNPFAPLLEASRLPLQARRATTGRDAHPSDALPRSRPHRPQKWPKLLNRMTAPGRSPTSAAQVASRAVEDEATRTSMLSSPGYRLAAAARLKSNTAAPPQPP